jgi:hypothetical protein
MQNGPLCSLPQAKNAPRRSAVPQIWRPQLGMMASSPHSNRFLMRAGVGFKDQRVGCFLFLSLPRTLFLAFHAIDSSSCLIWTFIMLFVFAFLVCVLASVANALNCTGINAIKPECSSSESAYTRDVFWVGGQYVEAAIGLLTYDQMYVEKLTPLRGVKKTVPFGTFPGWWDIWRSQFISFL